MAIASVDFRDALAVWRRNLVVHLRVWKLNLVAPIIEPVISVLGFGWGIGALVAGNQGIRKSLDVVTRLGDSSPAFPAVRVAVVVAVIAAAAPFLTRPTRRLGQILILLMALGSVWAITHGAFDTVIIMIVLTVFGAATSPWAILAPLPLLTGAAFMAGLSLGVTARVHDIDAFNVYMAIFFSTMYVTGAFFPLEVLPVWLQIPARILPQTEAIELTRAFLTGRFASRHIYEAIYLVISAIVACEWALRSLRKRMVA